MEPADIQQERVALSLRQTPLAVAVTVANAALLAALLYPVEPLRGLLVWLAGALAVSALRLGLWWRFRGGGPKAEAANWIGTLCVLMAAAAGLMWGAGTIWLWPASESYQLFWAFVVGGMCAGAAALHHAHFPVVAVFILSAGLPVVARMAMDGTARGVTGAIMCCVFLAALLLAAHRSSAQFGESVRMRLDLARQAQELAAAKERLAAEIAEHRATEDTLRHTQKMEAVGQLAGGVAHDFNNILQAVAGGAALIRKRPGDAAGVARLAEMVADAARRGESVTRRLLAFARRGELKAEPLDLAELLAGMRDVLAATLHPGLRVVVKVPPGLPPVLADRGQLETALLNLSVNARDAMPEGGTLTLSAELAEPGQGASEPPKPGRYILLRVTDTGIGMDAGTLARAGEPFFTTKPEGRGTGLGLSMARGFAEGSGGALAIESAPGLGTTIRLWLPTAIEAAADPAAPEADSPAGQPRRASLILVDDETAVRQVLAQQLEEEGYEVAAASEGGEALAVLDGGTPCDLIVCDLAMPGMDGVAVINEARLRRPSLPAILLTGYVGEATGQTVGVMLSGSGAFALLRKPVSGSALAREAASLLAADRAGAGAGEGVSAASAPQA